MKISTKGRYALRFMIDLAQYQSDGFVALKDCARRQEISKKYLEQIVTLLNKSDLLHTNRGFQGGYRLSKAPADISVAEVLRATEGDLNTVSCTVDEVNQCRRSETCPTLYVWEGLDRVVNDYLEGVSLQDIIDHAATAGDYVI